MRLLASILCRALVPQAWASESIRRSVVSSRQAAVPRVRLMAAQYRPQSQQLWVRLLHHPLPSAR